MPGQIDISGLTINEQTNVVVGPVQVEIKNLGGSDFQGNFEVLLFQDENKNETFDTNVDTILGSGEFTGTIGSGLSETLGIPVSGKVLFRDNLMYAFVDITNQIPELNETNNIGHSGEASTYVPPSGDWQPVVEWQWNSDAAGLGVNHPPSVAPLIDTNGDGLINERDVPAVIIVDTTYGGGRLLALRGDTGEEIFVVNGLPGGISPSGHTPAVGDLDEDGVPEIIVSDFSRGNITAYNNDGNLKWTVPSGFGGSRASNAALANVDATGNPEILFDATVHDFDGTLRWKSNGYTGGADGSRQVADVDLDGIPEVIAGASVYDSEGNVLWHWGASGTIAKGILDGGDTVITFETDVIINDDGCSAVANVDDDPYPEIIVVTNGGNDGLWIFEHDGRIHSGPFRLFQDIFNTVTFETGAPCIADFDGNGEPEIAIPVSKRPNISTFNDPTRTILSVYRSDGSLMWQRDMVREKVVNFAPTASAFDFDGNGASELVFLDRQKLYILNGSDGTSLFELGVERINDGQPVRYPTVADVDNDGNAEIIVPTYLGYGVGRTGSPPRTGILVLGDSEDNWIHARRIWHQYWYEGTNVNEDATIPDTPRNSWQIHNTYRGQLPIEGINPFAAPDLTVSQVTTDLTNCPSSLQITARIGNGGSLQVGSNVPVNFYDGDPDNGGILMGTVHTTSILFPGEFEDVTLDYSGPSPGQIFVTVNQQSPVSPTQSDNLSLLPHTWAEASGLSYGGTIVLVNYGAYLGIDGNPSTRWYENVPTNIDPGPSFYKINFLTPVNATSVTIDNTSHIPDAAFLNGTLTFSNGFSIPIALDANGEGSVSFEEQHDISWIQLTASSTRSGGANLSEFIVAGSHQEPLIVINEGQGRLGNNKVGPLQSLPQCDSGGNLQPQITSAPPITGETTTHYTYQVEADDPDNDTLTFVLASGPPNMEISSTTGLITWTPEDTETGNFNVLVAVDDNQGGTDQQAFTLVISSPSGSNQPPQITSSAVLSAMQGEVYTYDVEATDPDGDTIVFSLVKSATAAAIDLLTGQITWVANYNQLGFESFTVQVDDGKGGTDRQSFRVTVQPQSISDPPADNDNDGFDETEDCDDTNPDVNPGAVEIPGNGLDDDCNPATPDTLESNDINCSLVTDKQSYNSNSIAQLTITIENLSSQFSVIGINGHIEITDSSGQSVSTSIVTVYALPPNDLFKATHIFETKTLMPGNYKASLNLEFGQTVVCQAEALFEILSSAAEGTALMGNISSDTQEILLGESAVLDYQMTNIGNVDIAALNIEILIVKLIEGNAEETLSEQTSLNSDESLNVTFNQGIVVKTLTDQTSLNRDESFSNSKVLTSDDLETGPYLIILRGKADNDNEPETVSSMFFTIKSQPLAEAGPDQEVKLGTIVHLDGSNSSDPDGDSLTYNWIFNSLPKDSNLDQSALFDSDTAFAFFTPDVQGEYRLQLTVSDGENSNEDEVIITVNGEPDARTGIIGSSSVVIGNGSIISFGSGSAHIASNGTLSLGVNASVSEKDGIQADAQSIGNMVLKNGAKFYGNITTNGNLKIKKSSYISGNVNVGKKANLHNGARIDGDITAGGRVILSKKASVAGNITESGTPESVSLVPLPNCEVQGPGEENFSAPSQSGMHTILPGAYRNYSYGSGNTIIFKSGTYAFRSLKIGNKSTIEIEAPVTIHITKNLLLGNGVKQILIQGAPEDVVYRLDSRAKAKVGASSEIYGTFCGSQAKVKFQNGVKLEGALYAEKIKLGRNVTIISSPASESALSP